MIGFADELLGRKRRLSDALSRFYAEQLRNRPGTEQLMRKWAEAVKSIWHTSLLEHLGLFLR
jgi:hypothetical protein